MPFNKNINGYKNEYEFVCALNGKMIRNLNPLFQEFLFSIFSNIS